MGDSYRCLADPIRRSILELLGESPRGVTEITAHFAVSRPAISRHLRRLREAGLVSESRQGRERIYSLEVAELDSVRTWLGSVMAAPEGPTRRDVGKQPEADVKARQPSRRQRARSQRTRPPGRTTVEPEKTVDQTPRPAPDDRSTDWRQW